MKIITKDDLLREVPARWREQYPKRREGPPFDSEEIYQQLKAAVESGDYTQSKLDEIIGNNSWTKLECWECGNDVKLVVHLGDEPDYESKTFYICLRCLKKALSRAEAK